MYYHRERRSYVSLFGRELPLPRGKGKKPTEAAEKKLETIGKKKKDRPAMPLGIKLRIGKAALLFVGRLLSRVQYDIGQIEFEPAPANPALAGMAYGWSSAFAGAFPGAARTVRVTPSFTGGPSRLSGSLTLSIATRQIVYLVYRLVRDLPIQKIIKHRFLKRGEHAK